MVNAVDRDRPRTRNPDVERIKAHLHHPVIDADGHTVEITPIVLDFVKTIGATPGLRRFVASVREVGRRGRVRFPA